MADETTATPAPKPEKKPAAQQSPKKRHRFVRWIRRRHRLLTFIGALIVFGTFIVKDALREQLKDLIDSIERSGDFYSISFDIYDVRDDLSQIREQVNSLGGEHADLQKLGFDKIPDQDNIRSRQHQLISNTGVVLWRLPEWAHHEMDERAKLIEQQSKKRDADVKEYEFLRDDISQKKEARKQKREDLARQIDEDNDDVDLAMFEYVQKVLGRAEERKKVYERRYHIATWSSYVLYALGWGLGLIGRLVDVETGAGE